MSQDERQYMIEYLTLKRGWKPEAYEKMSDKDLERYYQEAWERP